MNNYIRKEENANKEIVRDGVKPEPESDFIIRNRLTQKIQTQRQDIGPELIDDMADWIKWQRLDHHYYIEGSGNWFNAFAVWALQGRCKEFVAYCKQSDHPRASEALEAVQWIYDKYWPHNTVGYMFYALWGWLQVELEKPGEGKPMSPQQQIEALRDFAKRENVKLDGYVVNNYGAVQGIMPTRQPDKDAEYKYRTQNYINKEPLHTKSELDKLEGEDAKLLKSIIRKYPMPKQEVEARELLAGRRNRRKRKDEEYVDRCPLCGKVLFKRKKDDYLSDTDFEPCKDVICKVDSAYLDDSSYYYEPFDILADIWNMVLTMPDGTHYLYYCLKQLMEVDAEDEIEEFMVEEFMEKMGVKVIGGETDSDMMGSSGRFVVLTVHRDLQDGLLKRLQVMQKRLEAFKKARANEEEESGGQHEK